MQLYHPLSIAHKQELANSISHAFGILFGIIALPVLMSIAAAKGNTPALIGVGIYGFSFLMVFTASTLYHSIQQPTVKRVLNIIDHISIYFLIAGTYTPFILNGMLHKEGIIFLSVLWSITVIGVFFKIFFTGRFKLLSTFLYLGMGWALLLVADSFFSVMPASAIALLATGGALYTLGVIFFLWERLTYHHAIWHFFVLSASICHYVAVLLII